MEVILREDVLNLGTTGDIVKVRPGFTVTEIELEAYCAARLARYKVPAHLHFVGSMPRNAAGKLLRRKLPPRQIAAIAEGPLGLFRLLPHGRKLRGRLPRFVRLIPARHRP